MISLAFTLSLTLLSFISSAFVLIRIVVPILPPNPLSRKVPPSEFGLPNCRSLSPAETSHVWLACLDLFALAFFVWQAVSTNLLTSASIVHDPLSAARLWIVLTTRQTCLFFIASLTLLYVRLGRSVSFGPQYTFLWAPVLICVATGAGVGAILANVGLSTLWDGLVVYSTTLSVLTTLCFGCLVGTLLLIRRNVAMAGQEEAEKDWPPLQEKTHRAVDIEDIEALKEGSSWITSHRSSSSSHRNSISAFSFSTGHHSQTGTTAPITGSAPSLLPKSSYWFGTATPNSAALISEDSIPPVPRVPSPYRDHTATPPPPSQVYDDLPDDPFHRSPPRPPKSSANSWLTSPSVSQVTLTEFSFPTTRPGSANDEHDQPNFIPTTGRNNEVESHSHSRATTLKPLSESKILGGYARQNGLVGLSPKASKDVNVSVFRCVAWFATIWIPLGLSLPYLLLASRAQDVNAPLAFVLLTISVTLSSPLLALNLVLRLPLPIPAALFSPSYSPSNLANTSPPISEVRIHPEMRGRSSSMTVVEGRRSGDVWLANGEAIDGRGKAARVLGLLVPSPRLAVLPLADSQLNTEELTPPLPIQDEFAPSVAASSPSANSAEMGAARSRKNSKASSYWSGADESLAYNSRIMIAQRHYSAMATTVVIPPSQNRTSGAASHRSHRASIGNALDYAGITTGVQRTTGHARSRSASSSLQTPRTSTQNRFPLTPPPTSPLPPTPPNVRDLHHSRSQSSSNSGFSFRPIGNTNQIDSLSAGVLPLLVPGLKIGNDMVIGDSSSPPRSRPGVDLKTKTPPKDFELGFSSSTSFNSPELHSTPARTRKGPPRKSKHLSLPSLGLGKDGIHSLSAWKEELVRVLDGFEAKTPHNRRTFHGGDRPIPAVMVQNASSMTLNAVAEENIQFGYAVTSEKPHTGTIWKPAGTPPPSASVYSDEFNTARSSVVTAVEAPLTSATALLQPTFHDQQDRRPTNSLSPTETTYKTHAYHLPIPPLKKSSIVYIKSNDAAEDVIVQKDVHTQSQVQRPRLWPTRASVKQSIPGTFSRTAAGSPLRKLTLLSTRNLNSNTSGANTRPLTVSKKAKQADKENSGLRPLRLARSATAKARGLLRQDEVLPDVVVRPPSTSTHTAYAYTFR